MGFNKRFITKEIIEMTEDNYMENLFNSDALIFGDDWSQRVLQNVHRQKTNK